MSGTELFLDTNIVLYLMRGDESLLELINGKRIYVSFITEMELLGFKGISEQEESSISDFLNDPNVQIIDIHTEIKQEAIAIRRTFTY